MVLTPKQKRVLDFIEAYFKAENLMPSRREIAEGLGLSSVATVQQHVEALEKQGLLKRGLEGSARAVSIPLSAQRSRLEARGGAHSEEKGSFSGGGEGSSDHSIPLLGRVAAGFPIEVFSQQKQIEIPATLLGISKRSFVSPSGREQSTGSHFALEVQGDSMRDDGILEGDIVILEKKVTARTGETVVALLNGEATLKRYVRGKSEVELHPANPRYPVMRVQEEDRFEIQGVLRGVIRTYGKPNSKGSDKRER
jgi:repressor LexA